MVLFAMAATGAVFQGLSFARIGAVGATLAGLAAAGLASRLSAAEVKPAQETLPDRIAPGGPRMAAELSCFLVVESGETLTEARGSPWHIFVG